MFAVGKKDDNAQGKSEKLRNGRVITHRKRNPASPPTTLDLSGVRVHFPFRPYKVQEAYMNKVLDALLKSENALLESPTGTGKTLCLLCACLAWQRQQARLLNQASELNVASSTQQQQTASDSSKPTDTSNSAGASSSSIPTIIYASRTHSQLSQVVRELRNTRYRPQHAVLGSREQMCIHPKVKTATATSSDINHDCSKLGQERKCSYRNRLEGFSAPCTETSHTQPVMDMEDLIEMGKTHKVCPFYHTRTLVEAAELILVPYNYLFDKDARKTTLQNVPWKNAVVIFDEAHNLESFCSDAASFDLSNTDLAGCVNEVQKAMNYLQAMPELATNVKPDHVLTIKAIFLQLEEYLLNLGPAASAHNGEFMMEFLAKGGRITHANHHLFIEELRKINDLILDLKGTGATRGAPRLEHFCQCLSRVFCDPLEARCYARAQSYRVHVSAATTSTTNNKNNNDKTVSRTLSYWCFAPACAMEELANLQVRSILVTSGTLSPLPSYRMELGLPFPHTLENPHIVDPRQLHVRVVGKGVSGKPLSSSYERRQQSDYYPELGNTLVALSKVTPAGMLIFFPSYGVMQTCIERWGGPAASGFQPGGKGGGGRGGAFFAARKKKAKTHNQFSFPFTSLGFQGASSGPQQTPWKRLLATKAVVVEPRSVADLNEAMADFHRFLGLPKSKGCILMGVCRGKISEGIDFAHDQSRAVVITGLPFPPSFDPKVKMKREYLDGARAAANMKASNNGGFGSTTSTTHSNTEKLSGHDWYSQQAHRAVNQAIGRVIRNRSDYGAVLLLDSRFDQPRNQEGLSKWVRPHVQKDEGFGTAIRSLAGFFKETRAYTKHKAEEEARIAASAAAAKNRDLEIEDDELLTTTKIAVIRQSTADEGDSTINDGYVAPDRVVARLDSRELDKSNVRHKKEASEGSKVNSSSAHDKLEGVFSKTTHKVTQKPPATASRGGIAAQFMSKLKATMPTTEQATVRKGIVALKAQGDQNDVRAYLKTARGLIEAILENEEFQPDGFPNNKSLLGILFHLLPESHRKEVEEEARCVVFRTSAFGTACFKSLPSNDYNRIQKSMLRLLRWLWTSSDNDKTTRGYLEKSKDVLTLTPTKEMSSFLKLVPPQYHGCSRTLQHELLARKQVVKMKVTEKRKEAENSLNARFPGKAKSSTPSQTSMSKHPVTGDKTQSKQRLKRPIEQTIKVNPYTSKSKRTVGASRADKSVSSFVQSIVTSKPYTIRTASDIASGIRSNIPCGMTCPICSSKPAEPLIAECGHIACRLCWQQWLKKSNTCATCRRQTTQDSLARAVFQDAGTSRTLSHQENSSS